MTDRDNTSTDKKQKSIRFDDSPYTDARLPVPEVHDEPYQYHKINLAWRAIIFGWLHILASVRGFLDADEEDHRGIQNVLKFLEPVPANEVKYPVSAFDDCIEYGTFNDATSFYPNNPFDPSEDYEPSLVELKWVTFKDLTTLEVLPDWLQNTIDVLGDKAGYLENDVFIALDGRDFFSWSTLPDMLSAVTTLNWFPRIEVNINGSGIVQLKFVQVPLGCNVLIWWDIEPSLEDVINLITSGGIFENFYLIELERDLIAVPPETISTRISEVVFEDEGDHYIQCVFIPTFNDQLPFVFPFGGFRELQVCDGIEVIGVSTGTPTKPDKLRQGLIMATVDEICEGFICAIEEIAQRILLSQDKDNLLSGITVDKDTGKITLSQADIDRTDVDGSDQEKRYGGVFEQAKNIVALFDDMNSYIDNPFAVGTIISLTQTFVGIDGILDPSLAGEWLTAITNYFNADPEFDIDVDELALLYFCDGVGTGGIQYGIDQTVRPVDPWTESELNLWTDIIKLIPKTSYQAWYRDGAFTPLDGYQSAPCYRFPTVSSNYGTSDLSSQDKQLPIQPAWSGLPSAPNEKSRRYRVEIAGSLTGDNWHFDGAFLTALPSGVPTYTPIQLRSWEQFNSINTIDSPIVAPSFSTSGKYNVTYDCHRSTPNLMALWGYRIPSQIVGDTNVTGQLSLTFIDLGHPDA